MQSTFCFNNAEYVSLENDVLIAAPTHLYMYVLSCLSVDPPTAAQTVAAPAGLIGLVSSLVWNSELIPGKLEERACLCVRQMKRLVELGLQIPGILDFGGGGQRCRQRRRCRRCRRRAERDRGRRRRRRR